MTTAPSVAPDVAPVVATVLVGLPRALHVDASLQGLPVEPFIGDVLNFRPGWTRVRSRATGEVHDLPPMYTLTPVIPISD